MANEWNEIQTTRKISPLFQLVSTIFVLKVREGTGTWSVVGLNSMIHVCLCSHQVIGVEHWAVADPEVHTSAPEYMKDSPPSFICRFAVGVMVYVIIYFLQVGSAHSFMVQYASLSCDKVSTS